MRLDIALNLLINELEKDLGFNEIKVRFCVEGSIGSIEVEFKDIEITHKINLPLYIVDLLGNDFENSYRELRSIAKSVAERG